METLEATKEEKDVIATLSLLVMVIKSVPQPVLRKKFADTGDIFLQLLDQFAESENQNVLRSVSYLFYRLISFILCFKLNYFTDNWEYFRVTSSPRIFIMVSWVDIKNVQSSFVICYPYKAEYSKSCTTCN